MEQPKTRPTKNSVDAYIVSIEDERQRDDSKQLLRLMRDVTGEPPVMWGSSIIGFGKMHYKYATGREGDTMAVGFSARKQALVLYGVIYYQQNLEKAKELGKYKLGKGCLYVKNLKDINVEVLREMIRTAYESRNIEP